MIPHHPPKKKGISHACRQKHLQHLSDFSSRKVSKTVKQTFSLFFLEISHNFLDWYIPPSTTPKNVSHDFFQDTIHGILVLRISDDLMLRRERRQGGDAIGKVLADREAVHLEGRSQKPVINLDYNPYKWKNMGNWGSFTFFHPTGVLLSFT